MTVRRDDGFRDVDRVRDALRLSIVLRRRDERLDDAFDLLCVCEHSLQALAVVRLRALPPERKLGLGHQLRKRCAQLV